MRSDTFVSTAGFFYRISQACKINHFCNLLFCDNCGALVFNIHCVMTLIFELWLLMLSPISFRSWQCELEFLPLHPSVFTVHFRELFLHVSTHFTTYMKHLCDIVKEVHITLSWHAPYQFSLLSFVIHCLFFKWFCCAFVYWWWDRKRL